MRILGWLAVATLLGCSDPDPGPQPIQCDVAREDERACAAVCAATCGRDFDCCYAEDGAWQIYEADCGPCPDAGAAM